MPPNANIVEIPIESYGINEYECNFRLGIITTHRGITSYEHYNQTHISNQPIQSTFNNFQINEPNPIRNPRPIRNPHIHETLPLSERQRNNILMLENYFSH